MNPPRSSYFGLPGGAFRIGWACALAAIAATLYLVDPATAAWLPKCPMHWLTGWHCPGCGSTRAAHALVHLDPARALSNNPLLVCGAPLVAAFCIWHRRRLGPNWAALISARWIVFALLVLVGFAVLRNVPSHPFSLLAPL